jgi:hypothetical protein
LLVEALDPGARQIRRDDPWGWSYLRYDFEPSPVDELALMRLISDIV